MLSRLFHEVFDLIDRGFYLGPGFYFSDSIDSRHIWNVYCAMEQISMMWSSEADMIPAYVMPLFLNIVLDSEIIAAARDLINYDFLGCWSLQSLFYTIQEPANILRYTRLLLRNGLSLSSMETSLRGLIFVIRETIWFLSYSSLVWIIANALRISSWHSTSDAARCTRATCPSAVRK